MTDETVNPAIESVLAKLAELTVQLTGSQRDTLTLLIMAGLGEIAATAEPVVADDTSSAPDPSDVSAVAAHLYALRATMSDDEQLFLDALVATGIGAPEPEVIGHGQRMVTPLTAPPIYSSYLKQYGVAGGTHWAATALQSHSANVLNTFGSYTCWRW